MDNIQPYEVSLWIKERRTTLLDNIEHAYIQDKRIGILATDGLISNDRISNIVFTRKVDGSRALSFQLTKRFIDDNGAVRFNRFYNLLKNESLVKLKYKNVWYEFLIKNIEEDKSNYLITYTCTDAFIEELSKIGENIVLDTELENNFGTVQEIGETILLGTGWTVDPASDTILQKTNSPLYEGIALAQITIQNITNDFNSNSITTIAIGEVFYYFYNEFHQRSNTLQILYRADQNYLLDDNLGIYNSDNFIAEEITYVEGTPTSILQSGVEIITNNQNIADKQGKKVVRAQLTKYEVNKDKYVSIYVDGQDNTVYGYTETEYITNSTVQNYITNSSKFVDLSGFKYIDGLDFSTFIYPPYDASTTENLTAWLNATKKQYLKVKLTEANSLLCNTGFSDNKTEIETLTTGEEYTIKLKYDKGSIPGAKANKLKARVCKYTLVGSVWTLDNSHIYFEFDNLSVSGDYFVQTSTCLLNANKADLASVGIFLYTDVIDTDYYFLEDLQLFKTVYDYNSVQIFPDTVVSSEAKTKYIYYDLINGQTGEEAINYLYVDYTPAQAYTPKYDSNYNKISSISGSESNCFNLLQDLVEEFECWLEVNVAHNADGSLDLDENLHPIKTVKFKRYVGVPNYAGFHLNINLGNIKRNIISDDLVTKLVVKNNDNEHLEDGTCSIARAVDNVSRENFIINFNYYIQQGLLSYVPVLRDLYGIYDGDLAYLTKLGTYNNQYDLNTAQLTAISANLLKLDAQKIVYENAITAAETESQQYKNDLFSYSGRTYAEILSGSYSALLKDQNVEDYITSIQNLITQKATYEALLNDLNARVVTETVTQSTLISANTAILVNKAALHREFYDIYAPFIKEGKWVDNTYLDDNLYYLDGCMVLNNSAHPSIEYVIDVVDVSGVEGLANFNFNIGDQTFVQDEEYFGSIAKAGILTPVRQEIIISEYSSTLDDPSKDKITVKTYKHTYEDLFQKMTAQAQALQFSEGSYGRAASAILQNGEIKVSVLQSTLANNAVTLANAKNQSVIWDENGISISNLLNASELVRMVSGGIFMSADGGNTWTAGVTAKGINTALLTAGRLDVNKIFIVNEDTPTFRWTADGINAYRWNENDGSFDLTSFIRFDQYGLYGLQNGDENFKPSGATLTDKLDSIRNNTQFALLWDGFFLKSSGTVGYLKISSDNDIQIFQDISQDFSGNYADRLTLGRIGDNLYGLRLKHKDGTTSLITDSEGDLTLNGIITIGALGITNPPIVTLGVVYTDSMKDTVKEFISVVKDNEYKFKVDGDGNVYVAGEIVATSGTIGGFTIGANSLYSNDGRAVIAPDSLIFYDKVNTDPSRIKVLDLTTINGVAQLALRGSVVITGTSSVLGTLSVGSILNSERIIIDGNAGTIYHTNYNDSESDSGFLINSEGKIFARAIELGDYASIKNYLKMGNSYIFNPTYQNENLFISVRDENNEYASLDNHGLLTVKRLVIDGDPDTVNVNGSDIDTNVINGGLRVNGYLQVGTDGIVINGSTGVIYSYNYGQNSSKGWGINRDGSAIFNNVNIRGKLQSTIFEYNKLSSIGGTLLISPSLQLTNNIVGTVDGSNVVFEFITFIDNGSSEQVYNQSLALIWSNVNQASVDIDGIVEHGCEVLTSVTTDNDINTTHITITIPSSILTNYFNGGVYTLPEGTLVISTSTQVNNIELSAQDANGPRISMTPNSGGVGIVHIGNLNNIVTNTFGVLSGYGFYGENVFLEGKLYLPNAGITNDGTSEDSIRIWAGASSQNIEDAKFYVTQGGFLHAEEGEFSGKIKNAVLETSSIVGTNGLGVYGNSAIFFYSGNVTVDGDGTITGDTTLKLRIDADGLLGIDTDLLLQKDDNGNLITLFKVDANSGIVTLNSLIINGSKIITIKENGSALEMMYGQNTLSLSEIALSTPAVESSTMKFTDKMYIGDAQAYFLNIKNGTENIGYDVYILS